MLCGGEGIGNGFQPGASGVIGTPPDVVGFSTNSFISGDFVGSGGAIGGLLVGSGQTQSAGRTISDLVGMGLGDCVAGTGEAVWLEVGLVVATGLEVGLVVTAGLVVGLVVTAGLVVGLFVVTGLVVAAGLCVGDVESKLVMQTIT